MLVDYFCTSQNDLMPELEPLAEWANDHTEFGMPVLGGSEDE